MFMSNYIFTGKKRGASFKISGVSINAASVLKHEQELEPLAQCIPEDPEQRKQYVFVIHVFCNVFVRLLLVVTI